MNPIPELITDEQYDVAKRFISRRKLIKYLIKRRYYELSNVRVMQRQEQVAKEFGKTLGIIQQIVYESKNKTKGNQNLCKENHSPWQGGS